MASTEPWSQRYWRVSKWTGAPGLFIQHQGLTPLLLLCMNGHKFSTSKVQKSIRTHLQNREGDHSSTGGTGTCERMMVRCPLTFGHRMYYASYVLYPFSTCTEFNLQVHDTKGCPRKHLIEHLSPQTTYCVQAATVMPLSGLTSARSPESCISTL